MDNARDRTRLAEQSAKPLLRQPSDIGDDRPFAFEPRLHALCAP
jgi:hypothetical protein